MTGSDATGAAAPQAPRGPSTGMLFSIGVATFVATLALLVALPHQTYIRWQSMQTEAYARLGWTYERIHDDPAPIDIALIGTSHTMNGIDGLAVAQTMAAMGVRGAGGRCLTVTNLAIPSYGRNLHYLLTRELLSARKPRAIVLEVLENETRKAHPVYSHVASVADLIDAPRIGNVNYFADLVRLPYRQLVLAAESVSPEAFGLKARFDFANYDGSTVDNTRVVNVNGKALTPSLGTVMDPRALERDAAALREDKRLNYLPKAMAGYEYAMPRRYVGAILDLADRQGVPVYLLYLPGYGKPDRPYDMSYYGGRTMLSLNDLLAHREYWHDVHHLNSQGAAAVSRRLGELLSRRLTGASTVATGGMPIEGCNFGIAQRPLTVTFAKRGIVTSASAD
ncbi:hypothetical protein EDF56_105331 [Novosphingobium sp. PhB165]|uniref:hypothetical protein n=1 Tax=Novosphingobium sp. PhB165 TaxID=2485105 RepID=UPI001044DA99|nr:hypothetical protein [Novosphingobium sp. PhB165]TCM17983.1 hypothetical protein EDF56_105331 [Novosphingobium sp. PhB165]